MKNLLALLCVLAVIGTASAALVNNGDFEDVIGTAEGWGFATSGLGGGVATEETAGGNPDGHVTISNPDNMWGAWYLSVRENLSDWGIPQGETVTYTLDIKNLSGNAVSGGLKAESWDSTKDNGAAEGNPGQIDTSGDVLFTSTGSWASYSYDYTISTVPGVDQFQFVLLNVNYGNGSAAAYAYDNASITVAGKAIKPSVAVGGILEDTATELTWDSAVGETAVEAWLMESDADLGGDPNLGPIVFDTPAGTTTTALTITGNSADVTGLITAGKYYYWQVNSNVGSGLTSGFAWNFVGSGDTPISDADAGVDQYIWLTAGAAQATLTGTYTDDGTSAVTVLWEDISNPFEQAPGSTTTINSPNSATTTVDFDGDGWYLFRFTATDAVASTSDEVNVGVYVSACAAANEDPLDIPTTYPNGNGDIDGDCDTDLSDFAIFAGSWLECMSPKLGC